MPIIVRDARTGRVLNVSRDTTPADLARSRSRRIKAGKPIPTQPTPTSIRRSLAGNGSVTVTLGGKVTVRDQKGRVSERFKTTTPKAFKFIRQEADKPRKIKRKTESRISQLERLIKGRVLTKKGVTEAKTELATLRRTKALGKRYTTVERLLLSKTLERLKKPKPIKPKQITTLKKLFTGTAKERQRRKDLLIGFPYTKPQQAKKYVKTGDIPKGTIVISSRDLKNFSKEFKTYIKDNPRTIARDIAIWAGVEVATGAIPAGTLRLALKSKKIAQISNIFKTHKLAKSAKEIAKPLIKYGLPTAYATSVGTILYKTPKEQRAKILAKILAGQTLPMVAGLRIGTPLATRFLIKKQFYEEMLKLPVKKRAKFQKWFKQAEQLAKEKIKPKEITLKGMGRLPTKSHKPTTNFLRSNKKNLILGGSISQRLQMKGISKAFWNKRLKESDLDIYLTTARGNPLNYAKKYAEALKKAGVKRVSRVKNKVTIEGHKVAEFNSWNKLKRNIEQVEGVFTSAKSALTKTPSGITVLKLGVQGKRKLVGSILDKRTKDWDDFRKILNNVYKQSELKAKKAIIFKKKKVSLVKKAKEKINKIIPFKKTELKKLDLKEIKIKPPPKVKKKPVTYKYYSKKKLYKPLKPIKPPKYISSKKVTPYKPVKPIKQPYKPIPADPTKPTPPYIPPTKITPIKPPYPPRTPTRKTTPIKPPYIPPTKITPIKPPKPPKIIFKPFKQQQFKKPFFKPAKKIPQVFKFTTTIRRPKKPMEELRLYTGAELR